MHKLLQFSILIFCFCVFVSFNLYSQGLDTTMLVTNGEVNSIIKKENSIYIGGRFGYIGRNTGRSAILNASDGSLANKALAHVNGNVNTVVPDRKGGWYIGGDFTKVQGIDRTYIAHILPDGNLDTSWSLTIKSNVRAPYDIINGLVLFEEILYIGSSAISINGNNQAMSLHAVDTNTGELLPLPRFNSYIFSLYNIDNILYIGGNFSATINEKTRTDLAGLDLYTHQFTDWNPIVNGSVRNLAASKNTVCITGYFSTVNGKSCSNFAAIDATSNQLLDWSINMPVEIMATDGNLLYVSGYFPNSTIGGKIRKNLASIELNTGQVTDWNPLTVKSGINFLKAASGKLFVGTQYELDNEGYMLYSIDPSNDGQEIWKAIVSRESIYTLDSWNDELYVGGAFGSIAGQWRSNLACIDAYSGTLTPWQPQVDGKINTMGIIGDDLYIGGEFTKINNIERKYLASVSIATGEPSNWNPKTGYINTLTIVKNTIYIGGNFSSINGQPRKHAGAVDAFSAQVKAWNPIVNHYVNTITHANNQIYIGGKFLEVNGQKRYFLAAVDPISGELDTWNPTADDEVQCITAFEDKIYIGGWFKKLNGQERIYAASVNAFSGVLTSWRPNLYSPRVGPGKVYNITIYNNQAFLGGSFRAGEIFENIISEGITSVDVSTGKFTNWKPLANTVAIKVITVAEGVIYTGGFSFVAYGKQRNPPNYIKGSIFNDKNKDCIKNPGEDSLRNIVVVAEPGPYYALSDEKGNYSIAVDTGTYTIKQILPLDAPTKLIRQVCPANNEGYTVQYKTYNNVTQNSNFANEVTTCPELRVEIASDRRRRCFRNTTTVSYCNEGSGLANNVKVHVKFPQYVIPISANLEWTIAEDSTYVFDIGQLPASQCGTISILDSVVCGIPSIRGLTQCTKAWITPANSCTPPNLQWDKSDIALHAKCLDNGIVRLGIYNQGQGFMADSSGLRIYLDAELIFKHSYKLLSGDSLILQIPANGQTVRIEADQRPFHPKEKTAILTMEGCGLTDKGDISRGFVTLLPVDSQAPEQAIECLPIVDSFDPNDKAVIPQGISKNHYTPTGTTLEYMIRFQNTGTDTAYKVVVVDTLSEQLDITTLRVSAVSHPYEFSVSGKGRPILTFTFDNINLPDSNRNEPLSHGYIKFSIAPLSTITQGTVVENYGDIFFDYNPAVRTNTVLNTIYDIPVSLPADSSATKVIICQSALPGFAGENRTLCEQDTVVLQASKPTLGIGKWGTIKGGGQIKEVNNPASLVNNLSYGENIFEWKVATNTCNTDSISSLVKIHRSKKPIVKAITLDSICGQGSVTLKAIGSSTNEYNWYTVQDTLLVIKKDSVFITPLLTSTTTYYVAAIEGGCESIKIPVQVVVHELPVTPIITRVGDSLYCSTTGANYDWYVSGSKLEVNSHKIELKENGEYTVKVMEGACSSALSEPYTYEKVPTGIDEQASQLEIYPNPTTGFVYIKFPASVKAQVSLQDGMGRKLFTKNILSNGGQTEIPLQGIKPGMYILIIETEGSFWMKKLIVK